MLISSPFFSVPNTDFQSISTFVLLAILAVQGSAQSTPLGGLKGVWYGACTQPLAQAAGAKAPACLPRGNLINNPYIVEFNNDSWNFTLVTNKIKLGGKSYIALGFSSTPSPVSFVKSLETGFCLDAVTTSGSSTSNGYITVTRTVAKTMTGATFVTYEEVGRVSISTGAPLKFQGCPSAPHDIVCDMEHDYFQYRCIAVRMD